MTEYLYEIISIFVVIFSIIMVKIVEKVKFQELVGSNKAVGVIIILILTAESVYLSISLNILKYVLETVTSLSAILIFFAFVYLNKLQNAAAGLSIAVSSKIKVGDRVEIEDKKGKIVQIGLTKTLVTLDDREDLSMWIPNKKFDEQIAYISDKKSKLLKK